MCNESQFRKPRRELDSISNVVYSSAATTGHLSRKNDENDEKIKSLLEENRRLHKAHSSVSKKAGVTSGARAG